MDVSCEDLDTLLKEAREFTSTSHKQTLSKAVQSQLNLGNPPRRLTLCTPLTPTRRPTRHLNTTRKIQDWGLSVGKEILIIGDSNVARFPPFQIPNLQIDGYPGATFRHAEAVLNKATCSNTVQQIILSFGINNHCQNVQNTTVKQLQAAVRAAKGRFPGAEIWVPLINFSETLPPEDQENLAPLNDYISKNNYKYIPQLPDNKFETDDDGIHWTPATAQSMLEHWCRHLK